MVTFPNPMNFMSFLEETEAELRKYGIEPLDMMIRFMFVIESNPRDAKQSLNKIKSYLVEKLKRGITPKENIDLLEGILNYLQSEPATNEREVAMKYLFGLKFLQQESR